MDRSELNAKEIENLKGRVKKLEEYREKDKEDMHSLDTSLKVFISEMKNISSELKTMVSNFKEAIVRSNDAQAKELKHLQEKVDNQEDKIGKLETKINKETVEADAQKWKEISKYILTTILAIIIGFIAATLRLK